MTEFDLHWRSWLEDVFDNSKLAPFCDWIEENLHTFEGTQKEICRGLQIMYRQNIRPLIIIKDSWVDVNRSIDHPVRGIIPGGISRHLHRKVSYSWTASYGWSFVTDTMEGACRGISFGYKDIHRIFDRNGLYHYPLEINQYTFHEGQENQVSLNLNNLTFEIINGG